MSGIDVHIVHETVRSVETGLPAKKAEDRPDSEPVQDRLVEVMLALSGRIDVDEADGVSSAEVSSAEVDAYHSDATLERLAMLGVSFGL